MLIGARRGLGVALIGLVLGCGATTQDGPARGSGGSPTAGQAGSASGERQTSPSGGAASDAGAGGNSQPVGGSNSVAGSGVTQGGSPAGGAGGAASGGVAGTGGVGGTGGVAGTGEDPNKIVLFDGSQETFNSWHPRNGGKTGANPWTNNGDGTMTTKGDDILTKMPFTNVFVHLEYWSQKFDYGHADFRERGASGVFLKGSFNLVILDTFGLSVEPGQADAYCGAIHRISEPLVFACKPGGEWNAYDIEFRAEVCTAGVKTTNAEFVEVRLNGILVQQNVAVGQPSLAGMSQTCEPRGVLLQNISSIVPVSFRNIWAIPRD